MVVVRAARAGFWGEQVDSSAEGSENGAGDAESCDGGVWDAGFEMQVWPSASDLRDSVTSSVVRIVVCDGVGRAPVNINANSSLGGS